MKLYDSKYNAMKVTLSCPWGCSVLWEKLFLLIVTMICVLELCCRIVCADIPCVDSLSTFFHQTHGKWALQKKVRVVNIFPPFSSSKWILLKSRNTVLYNPAVLGSGCHLEPDAKGNFASSVLYLLGSLLWKWCGCYFAHALGWVARLWQWEEVPAAPPGLRGPRPAGLPRAVPLGEQITQRNLHTALQTQGSEMCDRHRSEAEPVGPPDKCWGVSPCPHLSLEASTVAHWDQWDVHHWNLNVGLCTFWIFIS